MVEEQREGEREKDRGLERKREKKEKKDDRREQAKNGGILSTCILLPCLLQRGLEKPRVSRGRFWRSKLWVSRQRGRRAGRDGKREAKSVCEFKRGSFASFERLGLEFTRGGVRRRSVDHTARMLRE